MHIKRKRKRDHAKTVIRWSVQFVLIVIAVLATLVLVSAFASRKKPDLAWWHHAAPQSEFVAADLTPDYNLEQYLQVEESIFDELASHMLTPDNLQGHSQLSRYVAGGPQDPARQPRNWNRTVELKPDSPKGGVLLLHGLSDSPYSMRSLSELFHEQGYYVLAMRMPGHGVVPAGLLDATVEDWAAAVKVGSRHVQRQIDDSMPFYICGYSNGGALAVHHTLEAIESADRVPDHLFLFSPAIGITSMARVARLDAMYGFIPYFEKSRWLDIEPEFDPYKYNSFPKNAGAQSWRLANAIQSRLSTLKSKGRMSEMPPVLSFQSIVDDTVKADVLVSGLYNHIESDGSEVVFFDINRWSMLSGFVSMDASNRLDRLLQVRDLNYTVTRLTNLNEQSRTIHVETRSPHTESITDHTLDAVWPERVFSLAHVAIPFSPDDPVYGAEPPDPPQFGLHVGTLSPLGERNVLRIPASQLIRIRHNPFYDYMVGRIVDTIGSRAAGIDE